LQLGHQAAACTSSIVNWRSLYGEGEFILRPPYYWGQEIDKRAARAAKLDPAALEKRAAEWARERAAAAGLDYEAMVKEAEEMRAAPVRLPEAPKPAAPLPPGWATAPDPTTGKLYYYHKKTQKVQWEPPTA
jgi:hypothetical protein